MFIGHFGVALAAKRLAPRTSLGALVLAAEFLDLLWPIFLLLGFEHVRVMPGITKVQPFDFYDYPFSHSLTMVLRWALAVGLIYYLVRRYVPRRVGARVARAQPLGAGLCLAPARHAAVAGWPKGWIGFVELVGGFDLGGSAAVGSGHLALPWLHACARSGGHVRFLEFDGSADVWVGGSVIRAASAGHPSARPRCSDNLADSTVGVVGGPAPRSRMISFVYLRALRG